MSQYWTACYTQPGQEAKVRAGIEDVGFGTFLPTFAKCWYRDGRLRAQERPLMPRYILVAVDETNRGKLGEIHRELIKGVDHLLGKVRDTEVSNLMLAHATGEYNAQVRAPNGQFAKTGDVSQKPKRRRSRPRAIKSAKARRRRRAREAAYRNSTPLSGTPIYGMAHAQ